MKYCIKLIFQNFHKAAFVLLVFCTNAFNSQAQRDTSTVNTLLSRAEYYRLDNTDSLYYFAQKALHLSNQLDYAYGKAKAYYYLSFAESNRASFTLCVAYCDSGITVCEQHHFAQIKADLLNMKGIVFSDMGDFDKSIDLYLEGKKSAEESNYERGINIAHTNIGVSYYMKGDLEKSLQYFQMSRDYFDHAGDTTNYIVLQTNIASIYTEMGQYELGYEVLEDAKKYCEGIPGQQMVFTELISQEAVIADKSGNTKLALDTYLRVIELKKDIGDWRGIARMYNNMADIYFSQKNYSQAIPLGQRALEIVDSLGYPYDLMEFSKNIATFLSEEGKFKQALEYALTAKEASIETGAMDVEMATNLILAEIYSGLGEYKKSTDILFEYLDMKDSSDAAESERAMEEMAVLHQLDKRELENARLQDVNEKNLALQQLQDEQLKKTRVQIWFVSIGLLLVLGLMIISFRAYQNKKKSNALIAIQKEEVERQKTEIEKQHEILEEVHREVKDSIRYAQRIQAAILPPEKNINELFQQNFILYQPKDIVAGDFYWMQTKDDVVFLAVADCTGHGVPGAMVSVVCNNALNRAVREYGLVQPGEILDKTRELVIEEFEKSDEDVKDGMDISLVAMNFKNGSVKSILWAGANNPLWVVKQQDNSMVELKGDKQPIGKFANARPFTTHKLDLMTGDVFYIFSDGFADQFGGEKGKKFKSSTMKDLLKSIADIPLAQQKTELVQAFENWRAGFEQIDDVCVIGVRV